MGYGRYLNSFKLLVVILVTCNNEGDPFNSEDTRVVTTLFMDLSYAQGQLTP